MDVGDHTTTSDSGLDQSVELFISSNGELEMSGCNSLDLKVLGSVTGELKNLSGEVFEDGSSVYGGGGSDSAVGTDSALQQSMDSSNGELNKFE